MGAFSMDLGCDNTLFSARGPARIPWIQHNVTMELIGYSQAPENSLFTNCMIEDRARRCESWSIYV